MKEKLKIFIILLSLIFISCNDLEIGTSNQSKIEVTDPKDIYISNIVSKYRDSINVILDKVIGYSESNYNKTDHNKTNFNSSLGNLIADILFIQSDSIFREREGKNIDFVLQNHGGIRSSLLEGNVKLTDAFNILPFDNEIVIVEVNGETVNHIVSFLKNEKNPHPISGITIDREEVYIQGRTINPKKKYLISTNDYLLSGGDNMFFLSNNTMVYRFDYKLRDAFIDFTKSNLKLSSKVDNRFIK